MNVSVSLLLVLLAQAATPAPGISQPKTQAQALLTEGTALYEHGDFAGALDRFQAAYKIYPSPKLQFNIAQADRDLGRPVEAIEAFEQFLAKAPKAAPDLLSEAYQSVGDLRSKLGRLNIQCDTSGSEVAIDGKIVGITPLAQPVWSMPGRHQVVIRHAGFEPINVTVSAGEHETVVFEPHRLEEPIPAATALGENAALTAIATAAPESPVSGHSHNWLSRQRWYVWAAAGGTLAFTAGAIVAALSGNALFDELHSSCGATADGCTPSQQEPLHFRQNLTNVLWALAGASAVVTGVSLYVDNRDVGIALAWRF